MKVLDLPLTVNPYSRCGDKLAMVKAVVVHWVANPNQTAQGVRDFFEGHKADRDYGSAQYVIGLDGNVIRCVPETEVAYHCGSSKPDPASGKVYTDLARSKFGSFANDHVKQSPNYCTIGIEHCHMDWAGKMTFDTYQASVELAADLCRRYRLVPETDLLLHKEVVGWKDCHKWFVDNPAEWARYKAAVRTLM